MLYGIWLRGFAKVNIFRKLYLVFGRRDVVVMDGGVAATIAGMQRDLDAYRFAFANIFGHLKGRFGAGCRPAIMKGLAADKEVNEQIDMICTSAFELRHRYDELMANTDSLIDEKLDLERELDRLRANFDKLAGEYDRLREGVFVGYVYGNVTGGTGSTTDIPEYAKGHDSGKVDKEEET